MGPGISSKPPSSTREPVAGDLPTHPAPSCTGHTRPRGIMDYFYSLGWGGWGGLRAAGSDGCGVSGVVCLGWVSEGWRSAGGGGRGGASCSLALTDPWRSLSGPEVAGAKITVSPCGCVNVPTRAGGTGVPASMAPSLDRTPPPSPPPGFGCMGVGGPLGSGGTGPSAAVSGRPRGPRGASSVGGGTGAGGAAPSPLSPFPPLSSPPFPGPPLSSSPLHPPAPSAPVPPLPDPRPSEPGTPAREEGGVGRGRAGGNNRDRAGTAGTGSLPSISLGAEAAGPRPGSWGGVRGSGGPPGFPIPSD